MGKSTLIDNNNMWVKNYIDNFDVTMGSFKSAQTATLLV